MPETTTVTIIGLAEGPVFGCPDMAWGAGDSLDHTKVNADVKTLTNGQGIIISAAFVPGERTISYSVKIKGTLTATEGTIITIDGVNAAVKSIQLSKKAGDWGTYKVDCVYYPDMTLTPAT